MKCAVLNRKGDYDHWDENWLDELEQLTTLEACPDTVIYQNDRIRLSLIGLESYERLPFRIIRNDFNLICLSGGVAISRSGDGRISLLTFDKGEKVSVAVNHPAMIHDLQNLGQDPLVVALVEFKPTLARELCPSEMNMDGVSVLC